MTSIEFTLDILGKEVKITTDLHDDMNVIIPQVKSILESAVSMAEDEKAEIYGYVPMTSLNGKPCVALYSEQPGYNRHKFVTVYEDDSRFPSTGIVVPENIARRAGPPISHEDAISSGALIPCNPFVATRELDLDESGKPKQFGTGYNRRFAGVDKAPTQPPTPPTPPAQPQTPPTQPQTPPTQPQTPPTQPPTPPTPPPSHTPSDDDAPQTPSDDDAPSETADDDAITKTKKYIEIFVNKAGDSNLDINDFYDVQMYLSGNVNFDTLSVKQLREICVKIKEMPTADLQNVIFEARQKRAENPFFDV